MQEEDIAPLDHVYLGNEVEELEVNEVCKKQREKADSRFGRQSHPMKLRVNWLKVWLSDAVPAGWNLDCDH